MSRLPVLHVMKGSPFSWRPWLTFIEKGLDIEINPVNAYSTDPEWLKMSPSGMAPILSYRDFNMGESSIMTEYIEEQWPTEPPLMPADPLDKAYVRISIDRINQKFVPAFFGMVFKQTKDEQDAQKNILLKELLVFTNAMKEGGPYFMGKEYTLADINMGPFVDMFYLLEHFRSFEVPSDPEYARYRQWKDAVLKRNSWNSVRIDQEENIGRWAAAFKGDHVPKMAAALDKK